MKSKPHFRDMRYREVFQKAFGDHTSRWDESALQLNRYMHKAYNIMLATTDEFMRPHGLTYAKYRILFWLLACQRADFDDGALPSVLSHLHNVSPNTTSALLSGLEEQGLIGRRKHPSDNRKTLLYLTEAGTELVEKTMDRYDWLNSQMAKGLSEEERQILITLLEKYSKSIIDFGMICAHREVEADLDSPDDAADGSDNGDWMTDRLRQRMEREARTDLREERQHRRKRER